MKRDDIALSFIVVALIMMLTTIAVALAVWGSKLYVYQMQETSAYLAPVGILGWFLLLAGIGLMSDAN